MKNLNFKKLTAAMLVCTISLTSVSCSFSKKDDSKETSEKVTLTKKDNEKETTTAGEETTKKKEKDKDTDSAKKQQKEFDTFVNDYFVDTISENNLTARMFVKNPADYGLNELPYEILQDSKEDYNTKIQEDYDFLTKELKKYDYDVLTKDQQILYDIMEEDTTFTKEYLDIEDAYYMDGSFSPMTSDITSLPTFFAQMELYDKTCVEDYIKNIDVIDEYFDSLLVYANERSQAGYWITDSQTKELLDQMDTFTQNVDDNILITSFDEKIDKLSFLSDNEKSEYKEKNSSIVKDSILPAYTELATGLKELEGTCKKTGALSEYDQGKEYYEYLIHQNVGTTESVEDIQDRLESLLGSSQIKITELYLSDEDIIDEYMDFEDVDLEDPKSILETLKENLDDFPEGYSEEYTINYVPKSLEESLSPAFYYLSPIGAEDQNNIFINNSSDFSDGSLVPTLAHEGYPGHLLQTSYFSKNSKYPLRRLYSFDGYIEGWGLYSENYSHEMLGQNEKVIAFAKANTEAIYSVYCLADIKLNYNGEDIDDVKDFISKYLGLEGEDCQWTIDMLIANPGIYLPYLLGYIEYNDLKEEAKDTLDDNFDIVAFHKFILDLGPCQLEILNDRFNQWLEEQN